VHVAGGHPALSRYCAFFAYDNSARFGDLETGTYDASSLADRDLAPIRAYPDDTAPDCSEAIYFHNVVVADDFYRSVEAGAFSDQNPVPLSPYRKCAGPLTKYFDFIAV